MCVFTVPPVRQATLAGLDPVLVGAFDIPLFVLASGVAAWGVRWGWRIAVPWTLIVTGGLAVYTTATGLAGWGVLIMAAASIGGVVAWLLLECGRIPAEWLLRGPLGFGIAAQRPPAAQFARTLVQLVGFWVLFLGVLPLVIVFFEQRWRVGVTLPEPLRPGLFVLGLVVLVLASALGLWSAAAMSLRGEGTPLPSAAANRLVIAGPYRWVRNPMAVAGIMQAVGVGLMLGSWLVIVYAIAGAVYWNALVRPYEEADLETRFGEEFVAYRARVRCWVPRLPPVSPQ